MSPATIFREMGIIDHIGVLLGPLKSSYGGTPDLQTTLGAPSLRAPSLKIMRFARSFIEKTLFDITRV
jgi:hypothetical protein